jgi:hypothetical protein
MSLIEQAKKVIKLDKKNPNYGQMINRLKEEKQKWEYVLKDATTKAIEQEAMYMLAIIKTLLAVPDHKIEADDMENRFSEGFVDERNLPAGTLPNIFPKAWRHIYKLCMSE